MMNANLSLKTRFNNYGSIIDTGSYIFFYLVITFVST